MELRPARVDEKDALARLFQRSRAGWTFVPPVPDQALPRIADGIFERHEEVWLAEEDGRLLGFLAIARSERDGWEVLEKLYVDPEAQNRGVGTALLDQAKALRPDGFVLWVFQKNDGSDPLLRAPRLRAREADRRRREHGARAGRALPLERERVSRAPDVWLVLLHQDGLVHLEMRGQETVEAFLDAGLQRGRIGSAVQRQ